MTIEKLPTEIFHMVIDFVIENDQDDLQALARASSICYTMALPYLFRTVKVTLESIDDLKAQIQAKKWAIHRHDIYDSVRTIIVDDKKTKTETASPFTPTLSPLPALTTRYISPAMAARVTDQTALDWQTLVHLLRRLPALTDFIFACCRPFPLSVLLALHRYHPNCRLHIKYLQWGSGAHRRNSVEFELAHSPCLFSVTADDKKVKLVQMCMRLAPNLREVTVLSSNAFPLIGWPGAHVSNAPPTEPPRWGLEASENAPKKASLQSLRIYSIFGLNDLESWDRNTQFSLLEALTLEGNITNQLLTYIINKIPLPSLKSLEINVWAIPPRFPPNSTTFDQCVEEFLESVPPLRNLTLGSYFWKSTLDVDFVIHHGSRLRELNLHLSRGKGLTVDELDKIAANCPLLEHMELTLHRSWGNIAEVSLYRALGSIPHLQTISLALDLSIDVDLQGIPRDDSAFTEDDRQVLSCGTEQEEQRMICRGALRLMLMNNAFDEALAREIFLEISAGKPRDSSALKSLLVWPAVYGLSSSMNGLRSLDALLRWLGQPWHVSQTSNEDCQPDLSVRKCYWPGSRNDQIPPLPSFLEDLWCDLWPFGDSDNPVENWSSFPLESIEN